jgi:3D (Asp-Asp-Asp) domain-containing protein
MKLFIATIVVATLYNALPNQTDSSPLVTASGESINGLCPESHRWVAVSPDLLEDFPFGECILVEGADEMNGIWRVTDVMNPRYTNYIDFLVEDTRKLGKWYDVKITLVNHEE